MSQIAYIGSSLYLINVENYCFVSETLVVIEIAMLKKHSEKIAFSLAMSLIPMQV